MLEMLYIFVSAINIPSWTISEAHLHKTFIPNEELQ